MVSTNTICFEGICRIYRNAVVNHVRLTLKERYPDDWNVRISNLFSKEWEQIKVAAETRRNTGELAGQLEDEAELLGVNHFYNLFERFFDDLFPDASNMSDTDRRQKRQAVLEWSRNIKNLRDPVLGHPAETDVGKEDAARMLDSARRILESFDPDATARVAELWKSVVSVDGGISGEVVQEQRQLESSTLPSRETVAPRFVGRRAELEELKRWLNDPYSRVWLLAGDGGKGKTAIAYEFAESILREPPQDLEIIIWLSAKSRRFESGQAIDIEAPNFEDLSSALDWVLRAYGSPDFEGKDLLEKEDECRNYLAQLPALIVLDDVDTLEGNELESVMSYFLYRAQTAKSKILLTSRRVPMGMQHTQIKGFGLASQEGINFVSTRIEMYGLEASQFPRAVTNSVLEACDGSPLFIQDLLRLCKVGETPVSAINKWKSEGGEAARRYALEREFEMLPLPAKKVLLTCALYEGPASFPEVRVAAGISDKDCYDAIQELQNLFLVPKPQLIEDVPRFSLNVNTRKLVIDVLGNSDIATRIRSSIGAITGQVEVTHALRQRVGQYIRQAVTLVKLDDHANAERTLLQASDLYPENPDLLGMLGWVYKTWKPRPRYTDARAQFTRASDLKGAKSETYCHWSDMERTQSEWSSAAVAAEKGLEIVGSSEELSFRAGLARSQLAKDLYQQVQYGRAIQEASTAEAHLRTALLDPDEVGYGKYQFQRRVHRATVINYEHLVRLYETQQDRGRENHFLRLLARSLDRWRNEHPDDSYALSERQRLINWFPLLESHLK